MQIIKYKLQSLFLCLSPRTHTQTNNNNNNITETSLTNWNLKSSFFTAAFISVLKVSLMNEDFLMGSPETYIVEIRVNSEVI